MMKYGFLVVTVLCIGLGIIWYSEYRETSLDAEPAIGAAFNLERNITYINKEPLKFGALIGGVDGRFIELRANGNVTTSGDIIHQSLRSHIGGTNLRNFASNPFYQIKPGRLTFQIMSDTDTILIRFNQGMLQPGVNLSNLTFEVGPESVGVDLVSNHLASNEMKFRIVNSGRSCKRLSFRCKKKGQKLLSGTIDIVFGGKLTIDRAVSGNIDAPFQAEITLLPHRTT